MSEIRTLFILREMEDNLGVLWISALLRRQGHPTRVSVYHPQIIAEALDYQPSVIGFSCMTGQQGWVISLAERLKAAGLKSLLVAGGPHPTFFPDMIRTPSLDAICRGEGEYAMLELVEALAGKRDIHAIRNFTFRCDGEAVENGVRPLVEDLDELPFPDRSYYARYPLLASNPYKIFITGRGCPFQCTFCFNHALHRLYGAPGKYIRKRSVSSVMVELEEVRDMAPLDEIRFSDDHFALNPKWLQEFAAEYPRRIGRPYTVNARADILTDEIVGLLKESGCRLVCFGIETGREDTRNAVLKKGVSNEVIVNAAELLHRHDIAFLTSNIIGLPGESSEDAWKTVELNQRIRTNLPWFSLMQYYPGTEIYNQARAGGYIREKNAEDLSSNYFSPPPLEQPNMDELRNIHSFSIIASRFPRIAPLCRWLASHVRPNPVFRGVFMMSYVLLTLKRMHFRMGGIVRLFRLAWRKWRLR